VPKKRDQGIGLNGSAKNEIVAVFIREAIAKNAHSIPV